MKILVPSLLAALLAAAFAPAFAETLYVQPMTKWKDGKIAWYYNPKHTPAGMSHDYVVESIKEAFVNWTKGCKLTAEYKGQTTVDADPTKYMETNQVTIGFFPFVNDPVAGRGGLYNNGKPGFANAGIAALNTQALAPDHLKPGTAFKQILAHEIGHLIGLGHTLNPYSIMYGQTSGGVNAYNPLPFGEDFTSCANLYGSNGIVERPYYGGAFVPDTSHGISVSMETAMPGDTPPANLQTHFDLASTTLLYKVIRAPKGISGDVQWRLLAPSGDVIDPEHYSLEADNKASLKDVGMFWMSATLPLGQHQSTTFLPSVNGNWRLQATVDGKPAAEFGFATTNGGIAPDERYLEMAVIAEKSGDRFNARVLSFEQLGLSNYDVFLNSDYANKVSTFLAPTGPAALEVWGKSDLPRPSQCIPQDTPDVVRYLNFLGTAGQLADNAITVRDSGTLAAYSAGATIETARTGQQHVFIVALAGDQVLYRQANGSFDTSEHAMFSFSAPGAASFDVVRNINTHNLPAGVQLLVAYGTSFKDAVERKQTKLVRTFGATPNSTETFIADYRDGYAITVNGDTVTLVSKADGSTRQLAASQDLRFLDRQVSFDIAGLPGQAYRIYQAAFNRAPDAAGLAFWIQGLKSGSSLNSVAALFQESQEFKTTYGANLSNEAWLKLVYKNVLGREPDAAGLTWWVEQFDKGADRAATLAGFSESKENKARLQAAYANGIEF